MQAVTKPVDSALRRASARTKVPTLQQTGGHRQPRVNPGLAAERARIQDLLGLGVELAIELLKSLSQLGEQRFRAIELGLVREIFELARDFGGRVCCDIE